MSAQIKEALDAFRTVISSLGNGSQRVFLQASEAVPIVRLALEAAQQEAEARSILRAWCAAGSGRYIQEAPHVPYIACIERGIERYESEVETEGEDVLTRAAAWCRAELAK